MAHRGFQIFRIRDEFNTRQILRTKARDRWYFRVCGHCRLTKRARRTSPHCEERRPVIPTEIVVTGLDPVIHLSSKGFFRED
jgi:hypothetical protein